jgi:three-Cys-motif partner protein
MVAGFHVEVKIWSQIKHEILKRYLRLFISKLAGAAKRFPSLGGKIYYIDGFAGQGKYDDGREGSAYLAADLAANATGIMAGVLQCINVESDAATFTNLEKHTAVFVERGCVQNIKNEFEDALDQILTIIGGNIAFFFIDPLGAKGAGLPQLEKIGAKQRGKTEVLLRFDDIRISRTIGNIVGLEAKLDDRSQKAAQSLTNLVKGMADEKTIEAALKEGKVERQELLTAFIKLVVKDRRLFRFGLSYPITNPLTEGHHYFLVHFCNHEDGYIHMAHFMAWAERSGKKQIQDRAQALFQPEIDFIVEAIQGNTEKLNVDIIVAAFSSILHPLKGRSGLQLRHVYASIVDRFQWQFIRREWEAAVKEAISQGSIKVDGKLSADSTNVTLL